MTHGKLGALPATAAPRLKLRDHLTGDRPTPVTADWLSKVTDWPMYGNDEYGDCAWAAPGHMIQALSAYGADAEVTLPEQAILDAYAGCTGFDPADPSTDQGTVLQDALNYWRKTGIGGHKIRAFAQVDVTDDDETNIGLDLFGALYTGFSVYQFAMAEFERGQAWRQRARSQRGPFEGGHCVPIGRTDLHSGDRACVTWARVQPIGPAFWRAYFSEAWVVITDEWLDTVGRSPTGLDLPGLMAALEQITA